MDTRLLWFRRDLRLTDNPALAAALADPHGDLRVVPLFVLEPRLVRGSTMSPARLSYLCDALADLDRSLRDRGARLVVREGDAREVVPAVAAEVQAGQLHFAHDVSPLAAERDAAVRKAVESAGVRVETHPGVLIRDAGTVRTEAGNAFRVYSPYRRCWQSLPLDPPVATPERIPVHGTVRSDPLPTVASLRVRGVPAGVIGGGETAAAARRDRFLAGPAAQYATGRNLLGEDGTSRLSADLHYGCVSPRETYLLLDRRGAGQRSFATELIWRDFYGHVLAEWPEVRDTEFNPQMRDLPWRGEGPEFDAWREGRTGYPVVDAGMRQLRELGWMHNRARMVTASFLCKDLLIDWRLGQDHFLRHLVDGDVASNNGGWQWAAGTGTDAQPFFRIFNPELQGKKFDPDGAYVRRFVPELAEGGDYPDPIVDHAEARRRALAFFDARGSG